MAALIGAAVTIINVPKNIYNYLYEKLSINQVEFSKIEKVKTGTSLKYIKGIFGEPSFRKKCKKTDDENSPFAECLLLETSAYKYTFEREKYYLQILTDVNDIVMAYTIFLKESSFNPEIKLFLGRFVGEKVLKLGVTTFSEFEKLMMDLYRVLMNQCQVIILEVFLS